MTAVRSSVWLLLGLVSACAAAAGGPAPPAPTVLALASSCAPVVETSPAPPAAAESVAPFTDAVLAAERLRLLGEVEVRASPPATSPDASPSGLVREGHRVEWTVAELAARLASQPPEAGPWGRHVLAQPFFFPRAPTARLAANGELELTVETSGPATRLSALYGARVAGTWRSRAQYLARSTRAKSDVARRLHTVAVPVSELLEPARDVAAARSTGRGVVDWHVEAIEEGTMRVGAEAGATAYRCEPTPCDAGARFVELPTVRLGPSVELVGEDRATVSVTTAVPTRAVALVQRAGGELQRFASAVAARRHEIALAGLAADTSYRYQVLVADSRGEVGDSASAIFRTARASADPRPVSFVVVGVARPELYGLDAAISPAQPATAAALLEAALASSPDFALLVGIPGATSTTEPRGFERALEAAFALGPFAAQVPVYESMGSGPTLVEAWGKGFAIGRTGVDSAEALFARAAVNPSNGPPPEPGGPPLGEASYSFDHGSVHVAVVHTSYWWRSHPERADHPKAAQGEAEGAWREEDLAWLEADLAAAERRGARHCFVVAPAPAFPSGIGLGAEGRGDLSLAGGDRRGDAYRLFARHRVRAVFGTELPSYSRTRVGPELVPRLGRPLWQLVTAGAGALPLAGAGDRPWASEIRAVDPRPHYVRCTARGDAVPCEAVALSGEVIDRFDAADAR